MEIINDQYREYKLNNGLVVVLQRTPTQTVVGKLRVNYGSSHEKEGEEGMAHFLEHYLVTGGSAKYDPITADDLRRSFGYYGTFTNIGRTNFVAQMLSEDFEAWMSYVSDHALKPRFDQDRVNGEKERVLREISDAKSSPTYLAGSEFNTIFYQGHPKGRFNLGNEDIVRNADFEEIRRFHTRGFHPNNMDLILVGGLPENIEELVERYFGDASAGENTREEFPALLSVPQKIVIHRPAPERINQDNPDESSAQISLAYTATTETHPDNYSLRIMSQILGGDTTSFLFQNMGLKKGLAYDVGSSCDGDYNGGEMHINATVPAKRINEAVEAIFEEMQRVKSQIVPERTLERIRRIAKYDFVKGFESNEGHFSAIEGKLDNNLTPESRLKGYYAVTPDRVLEVANKYLPDKEGKYVLYIRDPLKRD